MLRAQVLIMCATVTCCFEEKFRDDFNNLTINRQNWGFYYNFESMEVEQRDGFLILKKIGNITKLEGIYMTTHIITYHFSLATEATVKNYGNKTRKYVQFANGTDAS